MTTEIDKNLVNCYNKGCGQKFDLNSNKEDSCQHHPGAPVFHDAYKGWSCCNKKSTDFSEFLSIPGCTFSFHSNLKPVEPVKEAPKEIKIVEVVSPFDSHKQPELTPRPSPNTPLVDLKRTIAPSLLSSLEKLKESSKEIINDLKSGIIPIGTPCKNSTCKAEYEGEESNYKTCTYHPGSAIFHEGMKYWSCCERKTSDFDNFLNQVGCTEGEHLWFKEQKEQVNCKYDFHQAAGNYSVVTVYSKNPVPDNTIIKANPIRLEISIQFEGGSKLFEKNVDLHGVIKVEESKVEFFQSKVEIKLKKADVVSWPKLEYKSN